MLWFRGYQNLDRRPNYVLAAYMASANHAELSAVPS
jgi:hypothetical protein